SLLIVGFLSMIVWGHHMFVTGMNPWIGKYFSIATVIITAPFSVLAVNLLASLWRAKLRPGVPMLYCVAAISTLGFGGLGGLFLGTQTSDIYFHETYFVVGHFHLMIGTVTFLSIFAAIYYWFPKMFGKMLDPKLGRWHFWLTAIPMMLIFILMHMQGLGGMVRRTFDTSVYDYNTTNALLLTPISLLAFLLFLGQIIFFCNLFRSLRRGEAAGPNPWRATTLEWETPSPAPHGNFGATLPEVHRWPYEYSPEDHEGDDFLPQTTEKPA
ncbi:MAG: cbb3-type cytochrome c oxidase subunit I, partial [Planctomycetota bacterium]|nr:cbb3-type cytochrome c oxidase subunit I [Planctomycetota bacterium]